MKTFASILMTAFVLAGVVIGCGPSIKVDTTKLEQSFQSAPAPTKGEADKAAAAIKTGDYATAVSALQKVVNAGNLTQEQKDGITTALTGMQTVAAKNENKYPIEVYTAMSDLIGLVEGKQPVAK